MFRVWKMGHLATYARALWLWWSLVCWISAAIHKKWCRSKYFVQSSHATGENLPHNISQLLQYIYIYIYIYIYTHIYILSYTYTCMCIYIWGCVKIRVWIGPRWSRRMERSGSPAFWYGSGVWIGLWVQGMDRGFIFWLTAIYHAMLKFWWKGHFSYVPARLPQPWGLGRWGSQLRPLAVGTALVEMG